VKPAGNQISYDPTTLFLTGRMPFLPPNQQPQSTEGKFLITPTLLTTGKPEPLSVFKENSYFKFAHANQWQIHCVIA